MSDELTTYEKAFELLAEKLEKSNKYAICLLYTSPSPRD